MSCPLIGRHSCRVRGYKHPDAQISEQAKAFPDSAIRYYMRFVHPSCGSQILRSEGLFQSQTQITPGSKVKGCLLVTTCCLLVSFQGNLFPSPHFECGIRPLHSPSGLELLSPEGSLPTEEKGPVLSLYRCHVCRTEQKVAWHGICVCLFQRCNLYWRPGLRSCRPSMFL